jgi:hypothetical protein
MSTTDTPNNTESSSTCRNDFDTGPRLAGCAWTTEISSVTTMRMVSEHDIVLLMVASHWSNVVVVTTS